MDAADHNASCCGLCHQPNRTELEVAFFSADYTYVQYICLGVGELFSAGGGGGLATGLVQSEGR
jgi:hypothetical protein